MRININGWYSRLVTPIDILKRKEMMYQNAGINLNFNAQTKKLWWFGMNINGGPNDNDFYEPRSYGRVFQNKGRINANVWWESNFAKKFSWGGKSVCRYRWCVSTRTILEYSLFGKDQVQQQSFPLIAVGISATVKTNRVGQATIMPERSYSFREEM